MTSATVNPGAASCIQVSSDLAPRGDSCDERSSSGRPLGNLPTTASILVSQHATHYAVYLSPKSRKYFTLMFYITRITNPIFKVLRIITHRVPVTPEIMREQWYFIMSHAGLDDTCVRVFFVCFFQPLQVSWPSSMPSLDPV